MLHDVFRTHRVQVARASRTSDGAGGWAAGYADSHTVEGSLQPQGAAETTAGDAERAEARWVFYIDPDDDVVRDDQLTLIAVLGWGEAGRCWVATAAGRRFRVVSVGDWLAGSAIDHRAVVLEEVQRGR